MAGARTDEVRCFFVTQQMLGGVCLALSGYWDAGVGVKAAGAASVSLQTNVGGSWEEGSQNCVTLSQSILFFLFCVGSKWTRDVLGQGERSVRREGKKVRLQYFDCFHSAVKSEMKWHFTATVVKQLRMEVERKQVWKSLLCRFVYLNEMALLKGLARRSPLRVSTTIHNEDNNTIIRILKATG